MAFDRYISEERLTLTLIYTKYIYEGLQIQQRRKIASKTI